MPRKRTPDHLMTHEQRKRRARNERYRSIKRDPKEQPSQTANVLDQSQSFEMPLRLVSNLDLMKQEASKTESQDPIEAKTGQEHAKWIRDEIPLTVDLTWSELFRNLIKPASVLQVICISFLSSYLIYQGVIFFAAIDPNRLSAISSAVVSEFIPFLCAACFATAKNFPQRAISLTMLLISILGLGLFMHNSLSMQVTQGSGRFERLSKSRELTLESITSQSTSLNLIPEVYVTKRQQLSTKINLERENLAKIDQEISALESQAGDIRNMDISYAVWIRIAVMLLNAYLMHLFFARIMSKRSVKAEPFSQII